MSRSHLSPSERVEHYSAMVRRLDSQIERHQHKLNELLPQRAAARLGAKRAAKLVANQEERNARLGIEA